MDGLANVRLATEAVGHLLRLHEAGAREGDGSPAGDWRARLTATLDPATARMPDPHGPPRQLSAQDALVEEAGFYVRRIADTVEMHPDRAEVVQALIDDAPTTGSELGPALVDRVLVEALLQRGGACRVIGELDEAAAWFRRAADAGSVVALNELGSVLDVMGDADAAHAAWIVAAEAGNAPAAGNLARFYEQRGKRRLSDKWHERATDLGLFDSPTP